MEVPLLRVTELHKLEGQHFPFFSPSMLCSDSDPTRIISSTSLVNQLYNRYLMASVGIINNSINKQQKFHLYYFNDTIRFDVQTKGLCLKRQILLYHLGGE